MPAESLPHALHEHAAMRGSASELSSESAGPGICKVCCSASALQVAWNRLLWALASTQTLQQASGLDRAAPYADTGTHLPSGQPVSAAGQARTLHGSLQDLQPQTAKPQAALAQPVWLL